MNAQPKIYINKNYSNYTINKLFIKLRVMPTL